MKRNSTEKKVFLQKADGILSCASMYLEVGAPHYWNVYRLGWTNNHWDRYLSRPDIQIFFIHNEEGQAIGYVELQIYSASIEIVNFGLRPDFIGQGYGKSALDTVLSQCFDMGAEEVILHTCSLDHPLALKNYYARGFEFVRDEKTNYIPLDQDPMGDEVFEASWMSSNVKTKPIRTSNEARYMAHHS